MEGDSTQAPQLGIWASTPHAGPSQLLFWNYRFLMLETHFLKNTHAVFMVWNIQL